LLPAAALVLAAGSATRMGRLKQLLPLGDGTVLRHSIDALRRAGVNEIVVVCGPDPRKYEAALAHSGARLVPNEAAVSEMADSVRLGLGQIDRAAFSGIYVCLADHPLVRAETCAAMLKLHRRSPEKIIIPAFRGRRGHPVLFPASVIGDIFSTASLRDIVRRDPERLLVVDVEDEGVVLDMDTEPDYRRAVELCQARARAKR
jgi:molybdenum cofactor cytidylyltransferase